MSGQSPQGSAFYLYDLQGSTVAVLDDSGSPVQSNPLSYSAYGAWLGRDTNGATGPVAALDAVGYGGKFGYYMDAETGLILCARRYYDPGLQR